jgi:hypothetical protein
VHFSTFSILSYKLLSLQAVDSMATEGVARFNVGGEYFEVSRSTLNKFPNTMLTRMASETWHQDPQAIMFIERDGQRFRYCLDYMRDGKVHLPLAISREALLAYLEYFGFENVDATAIE